MRITTFTGFLFLAVGLLFLVQVGAFAESGDGNGDASGKVVIVKVIREGAPLYRRSDGSSEIVRMASLGEEFPRVDMLQGYYLVKDEVSGNFLYMDPLDGVLMSDIVRIPEPKAYVRAPDEDWYWLNSTFFVIEDETSDSFHSGRYQANLDYVPRVSPDRFISCAKSFQGVRYKWGGTSASGIDCSGLIMRCLNDQGFAITHKASVQAKYGLYVPFDSLRAGDVLFFTDKHYRQISHTGMYLGNGYFIHAASSLGKVGISSIYADYFYDHLALARRY